MCHETTSVALKTVIGVPVGTVVFDDLAECDAMFFFGRNTGSNRPRFLHPLEDLAKRGIPIVTFNPVRERGLEFFTNPHNPRQMLTGGEVRISAQYHQERASGDIAVLIGLCKLVLSADDAAKVEGKRVLDFDFIQNHTTGFERFEAKVRATDWSAIEAEATTESSARSAASR